ncbi:hypothetical protein [Nocardia aurantiaca]|uniref:Uncharacterized protein n=1 Tax=Nocardia aurantiaca TaxID=2675850 RepID=A0A6I3KZ11_9NOCA|nr:hypothetical protein [Nocardia aurantiaca]MTE14857.1 hypothetical protein [Nocardia aurantiaca]
MRRRHREVESNLARRAIVVGAIPLALALACSNTNDQPAGAAQAGPNRSAAPQPGGAQTPNTTDTPVGNPQPGAAHQGDSDTGATASGGVLPGPRLNSAQPGVALPSGDQDRPGSRPRSAQPGVTTPNHPLPQPQSQPRADYPIPADFRPVPDHEAAPAVNFQTLHAPTAVDPVLPIAPPPRTVRIGDFSTPAPDQLPDSVLDAVNGVAADTEAGLATGLDSIGVNPSRSDKIAAGTLGGAAIGAGIGAGLAGVPMAALGGAGGMLIGAGIGAVTGVTIGAVGGVAIGSLAPIDMVGGGIGGTLIGAGAGAVAGAAALGVPAALAGGVAGGVAGAAIGGFLGGAL